MGILFLASRATFFAPESLWAVPVEETAFIACHLLLVLALAISFFPGWRKRSHGLLADREEAQAEMIVCLRRDPGFLSLAGFPVQSVRKLATSLYVIPRDALSSIPQGERMADAPWGDAARRFVEPLISRLASHAKESEERALAATLRCNEALEKLKQIQKELAEAEASRTNLARELRKVRNESKLSRTKDFYRLSDRELEEAKTVRQEEIHWIEEILRVRSSAGQSA